MAYQVAPIGYLHAHATVADRSSFVVGGLAGAEMAFIPIWRVPCAVRTWTAAGHHRPDRQQRRPDPHRIPGRAVLNTISVVSLAATTAVVGFIALARRRIAVAIGAVALIAGSNVTTQILKEVIYCPHLGVDLERLNNSLLEGHTTIVASVAAALGAGTRRPANAAWARSSELVSPPRRCGHPVRRLAPPERRGRRAADRGRAGPAPSASS